MPTIHGMVLTCLVIIVRIGSILHASAIKFEIRTSGHQLISNTSEQQEVESGNARWKKPPLATGGDKKAASENKKGSYQNSKMQQDLVSDREQTGKEMDSIRESRAVEDEEIQKPWDILESELDKGEGPVYDEPKAMNDDEEGGGPDGKSVNGHEVAQYEREVAEKYYEIATLSHGHTTKYDDEVDVDDDEYVMGKGSEQSRNTALVQIVEPVTSPYLKVLADFTGYGKARCVVQKSLHQESSNNGITPQVLAVLKTYGVLELDDDAGQKKFYRVKVKEELSPGEADGELSQYNLEAKDGYIVFGGLLGSDVSVQEAITSPHIETFVGISSTEASFGVFLNAAVISSDYSPQKETSGMICCLNSDVSDEAEQTWEWYVTTFIDKVPHRAPSNDRLRYDDAALYADAVGLTAVKDRIPAYGLAGLDREAKAARIDAVHNRLRKRRESVTHAELMAARIFLRSHVNLQGAEPDLVRAIHIRHAFDGAGKSS